MEKIRAEAAATSGSTCGRELFLQPKAGGILLLLRRSRLEETKANDPFHAPYASATCCTSCTVGAVGRHLITNCIQNKEHRPQCSSRNLANMPLELNVVFSRSACRSLSTLSASDAAQRGGQSITANTTRRRDQAKAHSLQSWRRIWQWLNDCRAQCLAVAENLTSDPGQLGAQARARAAVTRTP